MTAHYSTRSVRLVLLGLTLAGAASCATSRQVEVAPTSPVASTPEAAGVEPDRHETVVPDESAPATRRREEIVERGSGRFVAAREARSVSTTEGGDINLRFDETDIRQFIEVVLGDILGVNYVLDSAVTGTITMHTSEPIAAAQVLPLFEEALALNDAALVRNGALYQVVPRAAAARRDLAPATIGRADTPGFTTQVIPLQFVAALEMQKILEPLVPDAGAIRIDIPRNLVIVSGTAAEVRTVRETIEIFDVDWLRGMSMGLFPLDYVDPRTLETELEEVLAATAGRSSEDVLGGIVRLVPLERLTSLLVVSSTPAALREVELWIRRLDQAGESAGRRLYVHPVQNAKATELADILGNIFGSRSSTRPGGDTSSAGAARRDAAGTLAPGLVPTRLGSDPGARVPSTPPPATAGATTPLAAGREVVEGLAVTGNEQIEIIADDVRNALVILASPQDYRMVESALRRLDVVPLQVLIEARILEVSLRDNLSYGVEWFFRNSVDHGAKTGVGTLDLGSPGITALAPGFSYTVLDDANQVRLALNLLASESEVNVLSSPSLMVLDNQTATINVGDEIPVPARQSISNVDPTAPTVNEISFRQTGVTLSVTPRVNSSGLVTMEIKQEVSNAVTTTTSDIDAPTIQQRQIESVVAINSGDTIVLGGLMQDQRGVTESGVPVLHRIPVLGKLFGRTANEKARTELLVLITPRVIRDRDDARRITEEFRRKLPQLESLENGGAGEPST